MADWMDRLKDEESKKRDAENERRRAEAARTSQAAHVIATHLRPRFEPRAASVQSSLGLQIRVSTAGYEIRVEEVVPDSKKSSLWSYSYFEVTIFVKEKETTTSVSIEGRHGPGNELPPNWAGSYNDWHGEPWYIKGEAQRDEILSDADCDKLFEWLARSIVQQRLGDPPTLDLVKRDSSRFCFIATAVYHSDSAPAVIQLKRFRDDVLNRTRTGRICVGFYELSSPPVAKLIARYPSLARGLRPALDKLARSLARASTHGRKPRSRSD